MPMAKVVIRDAALQSRKVGEYTFQSQKGFMETSEGESLGIEISLPRDALPYPAGA